MKRLYKHEAALISEAYENMNLQSFTIRIPKDIIKALVRDFGVSFKEIVDKLQSEFDNIGADHAELSDILAISAGLKPAPDDDFESAPKTKGKGKGNTDAFAAGKTIKVPRDIETSDFDIPAGSTIKILSNNQEYLTVRLVSLPPGEVDRDGIVGDTAHIMTPYGTTTATL